MRPALGILARIVRRARSRGVLVGLVRSGGLRAELVETLRELRDAWRH